MSSHPRHTFIAHRKRGWLFFFLGMASQILFVHGDERNLAVLTFNIHGARTGIERIAKVIQESKADLVVLQEVDKNATRSKQADQTAELARLTGLKFHIYEPTGTFEEINRDPYKSKYPKLAGPDGLYARTVGEEGFRGIAVLSRFPILRHSIIPLPGGYHPRDGIVAQIKLSKSGTKEQALTLVSTHLSVNSQEARLGSVKLISDAISEITHPVILAGDINALPDSKTLAALYARSWKNPAKDQPVPTIPVKEDAKNARQIDYIFTRNAADWEVISTEAVTRDRKASDHLPYLVRFKLPSEE